MKRSKGIKIFAAVIIAAAALGLLGAYSGIIGVSANGIEADARTSQNIIRHEVSKSLNDKLCALIFYDKARLDYSVFIYVNRPGLSFGYFLIYSSMSAPLESDIQAFRSIGDIHIFDYDEKGTALISMNADKVARIVLDDDVDATQIELDPGKPFAVVIPPDCGSVTLFDSDGAAVPISMVNA